MSIFRICAGGVTLAMLMAVPAAAKPAVGVTVTAERMAELQRVNTFVNSTIVEMSDMEQYGREDVWTLPTSGKGDCEDFALLKRKLLLERGWPSAALSIAVGVTAQGEAHAVLTVATAEGSLVLDNLTSTILPSSRTGHTFYARQSGRGWIAASGERTREPTVDLPVAERIVAGASSRRRRG
ncbi:transglutaminase-like cysteine peptidase [Microvirga rosea]|uniref:transglutaminase-like cysteine peptidase n=1 Tax=Microvirga rosea TaxID=2715425 RepID=UPI001D0AFF0D|nr:transglutaminase-like cysteine peptidase [Microvirga rosea]MCB8819176.1 transglutaminase-like cysteine peptidase [Microvirga rosea]